MTQKKDLRPDITSNYSQNLASKDEELFQNEILRPILKLQHELIIGVFESAILKKNKHFKSLDRTTQEMLVDTLFSKDSAFRNFLIGIVVGLLEEDELNLYLRDASSLNKRIIQMSIQRVKSCM